MTRLAAQLLQAPHAHGSFVAATPDEAKTVDGVLQSMQDFDESFANLRRSELGKSLNPQLVEQWNAIYENKDRLGKVREYVKRAARIEEVLVGPRPEFAGTDAGKAAMSNSIQNRIFRVARNSDQLTAACDEATALIGSPTSRGIGAKVHEITLAIQRAMDDLHKITIGDTGKPAAALAATAKASFMLLPAATWPDLANKQPCRGDGADFL
eukprot:TRINITY_DN32999_c0_g1_i1.p1 TRINITY_DN32999_c0_g1~~TRINITY_DN32999_c0_g1_i1.p1  ORF type:complete len:211 (-),score=49.46 TRINITY_DN32999_c0_g1_i1:83-715(-)